MINVDVIIYNVDLFFDVFFNVVGVVVFKCIYLVLKRVTFYLLELVMNLEVCLDNLYIKRVYIVLV